MALGSDETQLLKHQHVKNEGNKCYYCFYFSFETASAKNVTKSTATCCFPDIFNIHTLIRTRAPLNIS